MVFAIHNFKVNVRFARQSSSVLYQVIHVFIMLFHILAAFGMICTAFFDMGDFPLCHEIVLIFLLLSSVVGCSLLHPAQPCRYHDLHIDEVVFRSNIHSILLSVPAHHHCFFGRYDPVRYLGKN